MRTATLGFVPMTIGWPLIGGALLGVAWTVGSALPVVHAVESDVPETLVIGLACLVAITPALLAARRHALAATLGWNDEAVTHFVGGRVKTAILWSDATVLLAQRGARRIVQITDGSGRRISLTDGRGPSPTWIHGRARIARHELDALLALARRLGRNVVGGVSEHGDDGPSLARDPMRLLPLALLLPTLFVLPADLGAWRAMQVALVCAVLLVAPLRRVRRAMAGKRPTEWIAFEGDELGLVRARRLDGARVLVDLAPALHPDALIAKRRGFVGATLVERADRASMPYRTGERTLDAVHLETQADRMLRFERMRTAFVDLFAYGGLFAVAVAAVLVSP